MQLWLCKFLDFLWRKAGGDLAQPESVGRHVNYGKVRDNRVHALDCRQRVGAVFYDFRRAVLMRDHTTVPVRVQVQQPLLEALAG